MKLNSYWSELSVGGNVGFLILTARNFVLPLYLFTFQRMDPVRSDTLGFVTLIPCVVY